MQVGGGYPSGGASVANDLALLDTNPWLYALAIFAEMRVGGFIGAVMANAQLGKELFIKAENKVGMLAEVASIIASTFIIWKKRNRFVSEDNPLIKSESSFSSSGRIGRKSTSLPFFNLQGVTYFVG